MDQIITVVLSGNYSQYVTAIKKQINEYTSVELPNALEG